MPWRFAMAWATPETVAAKSALRWATLAIEWASVEIHPLENDSGGDQLDG
jgi:hypothetical protein